MSNYHTVAEGLLPGLYKVRPSNAQQLSYLAEHLVTAELIVEGALYGWETHEQAEAFHAEWASKLSFGARPPELIKGKISGSVYYDSKHQLSLHSGDRDIVTYTHELAHSVTPGRGNGHTPRWRGAFVEMLGMVDEHAAELLAIAYASLKLTADRNWRRSFQLQEGRWRSR